MNQTAAFNIFLRFTQMKLLKKLCSRQIYANTSHIYLYLYATQNDVNTTFNVSMSGIKKFIGILINMGIVSPSAINDYWKNDARIPQIANVISRDCLKKSAAFYTSITMNVPKVPR